MYMLPGCVLSVCQFSFPSFMCVLLLDSWTQEETQVEHWSGHAEAGARSLRHFTCPLTGHGEHVARVTVTLTPELWGSSHLAELVDSRDRSVVRAARPAGDGAEVDAIPRS